MKERKRKINVDSAPVRRQLETVILTNNKNKVKRKIKINVVSAPVRRQN